MFKRNLSFGILRLDKKNYGVWVHSTTGSTDIFATYFSFTFTSPITIPFINDHFGQIPYAIPSITHFSLFKISCSPLPG